jgi:hypothetical protein
MKILRLGAELFLADRRIDMTNLTVAFQNFAKAHKIAVRLQTTFFLLDANGHDLYVE